MSILLVTAIVTGGVSLCVTALGLGGLRYARYIDEKDVAEAEKERKFFAERAAEPLRVAEQKRIEDAKIANELESKKRNALREARIESESQDRLSQLASLPEGDYVSKCHFCQGEGGTLKYDAALYNFKHIKGAVASGYRMWKGLIVACVDNPGGAGKSTFLNDRANDKDRKTGPCSPYTVTFDGITYMWQICLKCGAEWVKRTES